MPNELLCCIRSLFCVLFLVTVGFLATTTNYVTKNITTFGIFRANSELSRNSETEAEFMERMKRRMEFRRWKVKEACKLFDPKHNPTVRIAWSKQRHLAYCFIPKTGNTNWKRLMLIFNNYTDMNGALEIPENKVHVKVQGDYSTTTTDLPPEAANYTKLVVVRHPFARLVSAYKDKVEHRQSSEVFQHAYRRMLVPGRNMSDISNASGSPLPTFGEFVDYLIGDFINELQNFGDEADRHWAPYDRFCSPCSIDYDVIGKLETVQEDSRYVFKMINATDVKYPDGYDPSGESAVQPNNYIDYFKNIETNKIKRLYQTFHKDFLLFDYELPYN